MKKTFCDGCGEEIKGFSHNLAYDMSTNYCYWTLYPVDGYHNTTVQLDLCPVCYPKITSGEMKPRPLDEVVEITFLSNHPKE